MLGQPCFGPVGVGRMDGNDREHVAQQTADLISQEAKSMWKGQGSHNPIQGHPPQ